MDTSKIVGEKIKSLREDKSITIEELAQRSGLAMEQIERIENNIDIPSLAPLIKIARVLGVRLGTFLTIRTKWDRWYAVRKRQKTLSASPIMRFTHANTWNTILCPNRKPTVTWSHSSLM